jgi:kynureninase
MQMNTNKSFAIEADKNDPLATYKDQFYFPQHQGKNAIYFCGNSLGLQPKITASYFQSELESWKSIAVGGYFGGKNPWLYYPDQCKPALAKMIGAKETEVTVMNALTVNLHLMMLGFYKPSTSRYKIIMEAGAFPSDQYAIETLVKHFGLNPSDAIIEIEPQEGEKTLHTKDIIKAIEAAGDSLAMVMLGGINYYTGQFFDLEKITEKAHAVGAIAGFDLAHVVGNIPLQLHDWNVDFAVWCSYKYLNAGPGAVGGAFINEMHSSNINTPRLGGWWGNDEKERFKMEKGFIPKADANGWNLSTSQVFNTAALNASLTIFNEVGIEAIRKKSLLLTAYLEYLLHQLNNISFDIITPKNPLERGAQLSLYFNKNGKAIHTKLIESGVIVDFREPGVIRVAPAPLYCSFEDVYRFYEIIKDNF